MLCNEELLVVLRQPQPTGSSRSICSAYSRLEGKTSFPIRMYKDEISARIPDILTQVFLNFFSPTR